MLDPGLAVGILGRPSDVNRRSRISRLFELCYLSLLPPEQERDKPATGRQQQLRDARAKEQEGG